MGGAKCERHDGDARWRRWEGDGAMAGARWAIPAVLWDTMLLSMDAGEGQGR